MISSAFLKKVHDRIDRLDARSMRDFACKLYEERDYFYTIFDSMIEGVIVCDEFHVAQYVNRTASLLLGKKRENIINNPVLDSIVSVDFYNVIRAGLEEKEKIRNKEVSIYYPSDRIVNATIFPLIREGEENGNVIIFMDITREKQEQQRLRRAESMAALSNITAGIAHEIKNPLGAMDIHLQLMKRAVDKYAGEHEDDAAREDALKLQRHLSVIQEETGRLNTIVSDFLSAIRPLKLQPSKAQINEVVADLESLLASSLAEKGIELIIELDDSMPACGLDSKLLRQAFMNIVNNAAEAVLQKHSKTGSENGAEAAGMDKTERTPEPNEKGDEETGFIAIRTWHDEGSVYVAFRDNGKGIEKEKLNSIFEPYYTTRSDGTGLGLTIVYRIIRGHEGEVSVDSQPGKGSEFRVRIPRKKKDPRRLELLEPEETQD